MVAKTLYKLWSEKTPSIRQFHFGGCPAEAQIYMTYEKSWTLGQLTAYLLGILKGLEALGFIIPPLKKK